MKRKSLSILLSTFLLTSCGTALIDPKIPGVYDFKDPELKSAMAISASKKNEVKASTHNYFLNNYIVFSSSSGGMFDAGFDIANTSPIDYLDKMSGHTPLMQSYFSYDDNYLEFRCLGYRGVIRKVGNTYEKSGSYFDVVGGLVNDKFVKGIYDTFDSDIIYSFGIIDEMNHLYSDNPFFQDGGFATRTTVADSEWYKNLVCSSNRGEGNFNVGIDGTITLKSSVTVGGQTYKSESGIDYIDLRFAGYRTEYNLLHSVQYQMDGDVRGNGEHSITLDVFKYNVDINNCFDDDGTEIDIPDTPVDPDEDIDEKDATIDKLEFSQTEGGCSVKAKSRDISGKVVIPSKIHGTPVVAIDRYGFDGCEEITSVTIPGSVKNIQYHAFAYCSKLGTINIANGVERIEECSFMGALPLESVAIPDSVTSIGHGLFIDCSNLETITIGKGLAEIGYYEYTNSMFLEGCYKLKEIIVSEENSHFMSEDGVLYSKDQKVLYSYPQSVTGTFNVPNTVETITRGAFADGSLSKVTMGDNVTLIDKQAFYQCGNLEELRLSNSLQELSYGLCYKCSKLQSIEIPDQVTSVGDSCFFGCESLASVSFSDSIVTLGDSAFALCASLEEAKFGSGLTTIGTYCFGTCSSLEVVEFNDGLVNIYRDAFEKCALKKVELPNTVTALGANAFRSCEALEEVTFSNKLESIGGYAFYSCRKITSIDLPDTLVSIGEGAFYYCSGISEITIPDSVTSIGEKAFYSCGGLTSIKFSENLEAISDSICRSCNKLTSVVIPDKVVTIGSYAFSGCSKLASLELGASVKRIYDHAFLYCEQIETITFPSSLVSIGEQAFAACTKLHTITFMGEPKLTRIGQFAFTNCSKLTNIVFHGTIAQWNNVEKMDGWNASVPATAAHCDDGDVDIPKYVYSY